MIVAGIIIEAVTYTLIALLLVRLVAGFVQMFARSWVPTGAALLSLEIIYSATDPPIRLMRRIAPPIRVGNASFDLAFTLVFVIAIVVQRVSRSVLLS